MKTAKTKGNMPTPRPTKHRRKMSTKAYPRGPMDAEMFEFNYCVQTPGMTLTSYRKQFVTLPRPYDDPNCPGWAAVNLDPDSIRAHLDLYWKPE